MDALTFSPCYRVAESSSFVSGSRICLRNGSYGGDLLKAPASRFNAARLRQVEHRGWNGGRFSTFTKISAAKKDEYPWPDNIDPNMESGFLALLNDYKPLAEKPRIATLDFEKPLVELERKIADVRKMADETGLDFTDQISSLESKYQQAVEELYKHLTPFQRMNLARHPNRPTCLDHILNITDTWVELHGDRAGYDDPAIVSGLGTINGKTYMFIGHQKGRNTKENIHRNFGMPTPHGYRKALRMLRYADHHGFPIITLVDTPGAFADMKCEELGQGEAIAVNLREMFGLKVPIVSVVIGEGGSGGALAICCANKLFMLENSVFYVASPEACAAILWKDSKQSPMAADCLKITSTDLVNLKISDGIIPEPLGGAHTDPTWTSQQIKIKVMEAMKELCEMDPDVMLNQRRTKYRNMGVFIEGVHVDEELKWDMKQKEFEYDLEDGDDDLDTDDTEKDIDAQTEAMEEANGSSSLTITPEMIETLQQEIDKEMADAFIFMDLGDKLKELKAEISNSPDGALSGPLQERVDRLMQEFEFNLSQPGPYAKLKRKFETLAEWTELLEEKQREEANEKIYQELVREKLEILRKTHEKAAANGSLLTDDQAKVRETKEELLDFLESLNLEALGLSMEKDYAMGDPELLMKAEELTEMEIEKAIDEAGLRSKIDVLREELMKAETEGEFDREKAAKLEAEISEQIDAVIDADRLKQKVEATLELPGAFDKAYLVVKEELEKAISEAGIRSKVDELREELKAEVETGFSFEKVEKLQLEIRGQISAAIDMEKLRDRIDEALAELPTLSEAQETVGVGQIWG